MEWNGGCQDSSGFVDIVLCPGFTQGWIQDFPKGGGGGGGGGGGVVASLMGCLESVEWNSGME